MSEDPEIQVDHDPGVYFLGEVVRKADTQALITNGADAFPEDSFEGSYWTGGATGDVAILEPQFKPGNLFAVASHNNTLLQCVEAMEVNIDGTGHTIQLQPGENEEEATDGKKKKLDPEREALEQFFAEPFPGRSMIELRRELRRDIETTGNGYLEVIRNLKDEVIMLNVISSVYTRMIRLDAAVPANKKLMRNGAEVEVQIRARERRFVQIINDKKTYFKEFGASRDLDRDTGLWHEPKGTGKGARLSLDKRASEIIHFRGNLEPKTPYGVPRWVNQLPSALGSRKAEEFNLEYFDGGGLPPVLIFVQGGTLGADVRKTLEKHLSGGGSKHRAAVVEAVSTSGSIDTPGTVQVRVERFGGDSMKDALFLNYDKSCADHLREAFRLPSIFLGKSENYNFATAYTSYMVAEAQVFFPERDEFDTVINTKILPLLGAERYEFRSLPMSLADIQNQLKALELASGKNIIAGEKEVEILNEITGLSMEYQEPPSQPPMAQGQGIQEIQEPKMPGSEPRKTKELPGQTEVTKGDGLEDISGMRDLCECALELLGQTPHEG